MQKLVSINRYKIRIFIKFDVDTNMYSRSPQYHERYKNVRMRNDQPPHIFWVADRAYQRMLQTYSNQTVLISGDSGAGKTESAKLLIQHIAFLCKSRVDNLHQKIIEVRS